jgi:ElaB/YqjD/DUF883 family membrane-anchored ribosome-binding protein
MKSTILAFEACKNMKYARRAVRKGWHAAEEFVKKQPFKSLGVAAGVAFGVAFGMGTAAGWLISRR